MEVEIEKVSQVTTQALSAVKTSCQMCCDRTKDLKAFGACLSAELDEIKKAVNELASCESTIVNHENIEREEHAKNLQLLHGNLQSVSSKLEKLNIDSTAVIAQSTTTKNLTEALRCHVSIGRVKVADGGFSVQAAARVFENALKLPTKVVWSVNNWSKLTHAIKTYRFLLCYTDIAVDERYRIRLSIRVRPGRRWFEFQAQMYETNGTTLAASPKKMKLHFQNARICGVEHEIDVSDAGLEDQRAWEFVSGDFSVEDLEASGSIRKDVLNLRFTFFY
ncbi:hypothetical protein HPB51_023779 [Rhipicephalus microplus]|uniref:Uncharacterized protein n=1 Tax=Rhipicephalus microplus TaxID=6941 RepID=A0A9J6E4A6_RHIMP|nr:hypothetical protein HPB51_023779 [Rhipicephalus microplus]